MVRFKNRYITIEINDDEQLKKLTLQETTLYKVIHNKVHELYGDLGQATIKAGFNAKYCNNHTKVAIIKVRHGPHKMVLKALSEIKNINDISVKIKILYIGATIKHCFLFLKRYQTKHVEIAFAHINGEYQRQQAIDALMTLTPAMKDFK